jgi:ectoine hydroxylase
MSAFQLSKNQITQFHNDGYLIIRKLYCLAEIEPLQSAIVDDPSINGSLYGMNGDSAVPHPINIWNECGDDIAGMIPRMERAINVTEALLGDECYHWHSKFVVKRPKCPAIIGWHQDYASWYDEGLLYPNMLSIGTAITAATKENGCTQVIPGSHKMGLLDDGARSKNKTFTARLNHVKEKLGIVYCELDPGDVMIFHCNLLHAADDNTTDQTRTVIFSSYNARGNAPIMGANGVNKEGEFLNISREQRQFCKLQKVPDEALIKGQYKSAFNHTNFISPKTGLDDSFTRAVKLST